jgi:hypothetical protein
MNNLRTPKKKRSTESGNTSPEDDGYDSDTTVIASPYNVDEQRQLERQYKKQKLDTQNEEYARNQLLPDTVSATVILDRKTEQPFYIKNSEGILEVVTSSNINSSNNTFYNKDGEQINPTLLDFTGELGGKIRRRKTRRLRKKSKKSRKPKKKSRKSRKYK